LTVNPDSCIDQRFNFAVFESLAFWPAADVSGNAPAWAYTVDTVAVSTSAIGAPFQIPNTPYGPGFALSLGVGAQQPSSAAPDSSPLYSVEQCFPVLASYPVSCRPGDNVSVGSNVVTVQAGACTISTPVFAIDPRTQSATAAGICPGESSFSKATAVLGRRQLARRPALRCLGRVLAKRRADGGVRGRLRYGHWARGGVLPAGVSSRSTMRSEH